VAVTGVKSSDDITGNVIKAYVVTDDPLLDLKKVEQFCLENMEPYKVPAMIKKVDSLPKTSSGKIQRHLISNEDAK
jgi:acyl-coenzyme A synthetase/AMP-(fatty) acid ligase